MSSEAPFVGGGRERFLTVRRIATARRMRLAIDPRDGAVKLTLPPRASEARGRVWAEAQRPWIEAELARLPPSRPIAPGLPFPFRGEELIVDWAETARRQPHVEEGRLRVGGPRDALAGRVLAWARREALRILEDETRALAVRAGVTVARVAVGDPRARWGSCSSAGDIRYAWRLVMAPPFVLSATVAHEVAHRLHMDHSAAFRAAERRLGGDPTAARAWLRTHGAGLYWVGRQPA